MWLVAQMKSRCYSWRADRWRPLAFTAWLSRINSNTKSTAIFWLCFTKHPRRKISLIWQNYETCFAKGTLHPKSQLPTLHFANLSWSHVYVTVSSWETRLNKSVGCQMALKHHFHCTNEFGAGLVDSQPVWELVFNFMVVIGDWKPPVLCSEGSFWCTTRMLHLIAKGVCGRLFVSC